MMSTKKKRPVVISCAVFGGRSPKTGKLTGERHRWSGGAWGKGRCEFCGRMLDEVLGAPDQKPWQVEQHGEPKAWQQKGRR